MKENIDLRNRMFRFAIFRNEWRSLFRKLAKLPLDNYLLSCYNSRQGRAKRSNPQDDRR